MKKRMFLKKLPVTTSKADKFWTMTLCTMISASTKSFEIAGTSNLGTKNGSKIGMPIAG